MSLRAIFWIIFIGSLIPLGISAYRGLRFDEEDERWLFWLKIAIGWITVSFIFALFIPIQSPQRASASADDSKPQPTTPSD